MPILPVAYRNAAFSTITAGPQRAQGASSFAAEKCPHAAEKSPDIGEKIPGAAEKDPGIGEKGPDAVGQYDILEMTSSDLLKISTPVNPDRLTRFNQILQSLKEQYPHIRFAITEDLPAGELSAGAAQAGKGNHILISQGFLSRLQQSDKDFDTCQQMLRNACQQLTTGGMSGMTAAQGVYLGKNASISWSVSAKKNTMNPLTQKNKEETLLDKMSSLSTTSDTQKLKRYLSASSRKTNTREHYMRLANAKSKSSVKSAMSDVQRSIASLQLTASLGTDKERMEARRAIRSCQKLLLRGRQKIKRFDQEALVKTRKKSAEKQQQIRRARRAKEELEKKRTSRHIADSAIRCEGRLQNCIYRSVRRHDPYDDEYYDPYLGASMPAGAGTGEAVPSGETAAIAPADVTITSVTTF